jgi:hypothetical protein
LRTGGGAVRCTDSGNRAHSAQVNNGGAEVICKQLKAWCVWPPNTPEM